jgi:hypothetical protein
MRTRRVELQGGVMDIQTCPRRMHEMGPWDRSEGQDSWRSEPRREGEAVPYCSFCGSLHPGQFLKLIAEGWAVEPTDKNYKAYLHPVHSGPERESVPGQPLPEISPHIQAKFYYQHLSPSQQQQFIDLYNGGSMRMAYPGHFYVVPFFMRLAPHPEG